VSKFDHRLKRLESKTGIVKHVFEYWVIWSYGKDKPFVEKEIQDIKAGKIAGKGGSMFDPENPKQLIIISGTPRPDPRKLKEEKISSFIEEEIAPRDLTDEELEAEIRNAQKELDSANITGTA